MKKIDYMTMSAADLAAMQEQINAVNAEREAVKGIVESCAAYVEEIRGYQERIIAGKNAGDDAKAAGSDLWRAVFNVARTVADATEEAPEMRAMAFADAMADFLQVKQGEDGKPLKLSTAGQYASTGKKLLEKVTKDNLEIASFADMTRKDVMLELKPQDHAAMLKDIVEASKNMRFIVKNGTDDERESLRAIFEAVTVFYQPVKTRKEAESTKVQAAKTLADDRQQAPTEPAELETVIAAIVEDDAVVEDKPLADVANG